MVNGSLHMPEQMHSDLFCGCLLYVGRRRGLACHTISYMNLNETLGMTTDQNTFSIFFGNFKHFQVSETQMNSGVLKQKFIPWRYSLIAWFGNTTVTFEPIR